ncbi:hypothetical protein LYNGBM3L_04200 [Moorena producens 3L]|uniref:PH domain-containing protein n=1 Tax=Moorena producens 3L TaxID=489825 RepID=F4XIU2_9CYAN|nr:hypothetical protein LYNGBM3L_04200 [Moorena producens 3L]
MENKFTLGYKSLKALFSKDFGLYFFYFRAYPHQKKKEWLSAFA